MALRRKNDRLVRGRTARHHDVQHGTLSGDFFPVASAALVTCRDGLARAATLLAFHLHHTKWGASISSPGTTAGVAGRRLGTLAHAFALAIFTHAFSFHGHLQICGGKHAIETNDWEIRTLRMETRACAVIDTCLVQPVYNSCKVTVIFF
jgi:hypothetical protein